MASHISNPEVYADPEGTEAIEQGEGCVHVAVHFLPFCAVKVEMVLTCYCEPPQEGGLVGLVG